MRSLTEPVFHLCIPYSANISNDGLDTYIGWPHCKRPAVWWTGQRVQRQRSSLISLQRRLQAGYEGRKNGLHQLGIPGRQQSGLKTRTATQSQKWRTRPQRNPCRETQEKERVLVIKCTSNWWLCLPARDATTTASHASDWTSTPEDAHMSTRRVHP